LTMRRRHCRSIAALAMFVHVLAAPAALAATDVNPHAAAMAAMARLFVGHVFFDGMLLTEVRALSACQTAYVTAKGATTIEWSGLSNTAPQTVGDNDVIPLVSPDGNHDLSLPLSAGSGTQARRMESVVTLLYLDCNTPK
jgi:hypothetical protein